MPNQHACRFGVVFRQEVIGTSRDATGALAATSANMKKQQPKQSQKRLALTQSRVRRLDDLDGIRGGLDCGGTMVCDAASCEPSRVHCLLTTGNM